MRKHYASKQGVLSLAVLAVATFLPSASASVIGHLSVANCSGGGVDVTLTTIDWSLGSPAACLQLGTLTAITSVGNGSLTPASPAGTINDLPPATGIVGFMSFGALHFDLAAVGGFGPGSGTSCSSNPGLGSSCSVPGSPFLLTNSGSGTTVTLSAHGTIADTVGPISDWNGAFTTQIAGVLPATIQTTILGGGTITSTFSGEFNIVPIPEPVSAWLIGGGLIVFAAIKGRKLV
jgi:hypothetical protein